MPTATERLLYIDPPIIFGRNRSPERAGVICADAQLGPELFTVIACDSFKTASVNDWASRARLIWIAHGRPRVMLDIGAERGGQARAVLSAAGVEKITTITPGRSPMHSLLPMQHAIGEGRIAFQAAPELSAEIFCAPDRLHADSDAYDLLAFWHAWRSPLSSRLHDPAFR